MDWKLFVLVVFSSMVVCGVGFELVQHFSVMAGQIPPRGVHALAGKPFLHWNHFAVQLYGDLFFLSLLNGFVATAWQKVEWTVATQWWVVGIGTLAVIATVLWATSVQKQFAAGKFARWDWGFTTPNGRLTIAGKAHLVYFCLEAAVIGVALLCFLWKPVGMISKIGAALAIAGYIATAVYDAQKIGLSGGPFAGPRKTSPATKE